MLIKIYKYPKKIHQKKKEKKRKSYKKRKKFDVKFLCLLRTLALFC
jgi:hypothetical protein